MCMARTPDVATRFVNAMLRAAMVQGIAGSLPPSPGPRSAQAGRASVRKNLAVNELLRWLAEHRNGDQVKTTWI